jgi:hypothetical protein
MTPEECARKVIADIHNCEKHHLGYLYQKRAAEKIIQQCVDEAKKEMREILYEPWEVGHKELAAAEKERERCCEIAEREAYQPDGKRIAAKLREGE